ncbi:hypothetical protein [Bacillus canaveralius]|uniref:hypothetical protein n=1 Tax=Bacillus canaveralius TaxID=1403243 RepID=UPI000F777C58|nr:hypothetical protein [Bacillus canaveralius]RSK55148.1 hypothetical protein EJA13_03645 [Bacillus canaveralius]
MLSLDQKRAILNGFKELRKKEDKSAGSSIIMTSLHLEKSWLSGNSPIQEMAMYLHCICLSLRNFIKVEM